MEGKKYIGTTKNNIDVYMCESTYEHMLAHPDVRMDDVKEAIMKTTYQAPFQIKAVDLGRICGKDSCIEIPAGMKPEMRTRKGRQGKTPVFLSGVEAEDTSLLTLGICTDDDGKDTVFTAFYGQLALKSRGTRGFPTPRDRRRRASGPAMRWLYKEKVFGFIATCLAAIFFIIGVFMLFNPTTTVAGYMIIALAAAANGSAILILEKRN